MTVTDEAPAADERAADRCKCSHSRRNHMGTRTGPCAFSGCGCGKFRPESGAALTLFRRGDLVEYNGEPWTVYTGQDACGSVDLCRTESYAAPLGDRVAGVSASVLRLVRSAPDRTLGKGADIDYIEREDRNRRAARERRAVTPEGED